jgi:hypothetical protein
VGADSLVNVLLPTSIQSAQNSAIKVWPTLSHDGLVSLEAAYGELIRSVEVIDAKGRVCSQHGNFSFSSQLQIELPAAAGIYYLKIIGSRKVYYKKVVKS